MTFPLLNKVLLKMKKKKEKLQRYDLSFLIGKSYFSDDGSPNYLILQLIHNTLTR